MSDLFAIVRCHVLDALRAAVPDLPEDALARVEVTPPRDPAHGDMATNAALVAAKPARMAPGKLAEALVAELRKVPLLAEVTAAGPGFINLRLQTAALQALLPQILREGLHFGDSQAGAGQRVNLEYVSANPTGPMHIGHCRGAVVGDALANLMQKAGFEVTREYYINDAGNQVQVLGWATYWRYLQALGTTLTEEEYSNQVPGGLQYRGEYLVAVAEKLVAQYGDQLAPGAVVADPALWLDLVRDFTIECMMTEIREDLALLGVRHDVFVSERVMLESGAVERAIAFLTAEGLVYEGTLEPPKGKLPDDWEPRAQTLFRATQFGDDVDRPLRKSDGSNTYFANDIGYHADKLGRGAEILIDVWGADHGGYVSRMQSAVKALAGNRPVGLDVLLCQIVHVLRDGQPVRMSKRAGTYVTLRDLIEWVGRDAVRFTMLMRKPDAQMEFDLDLAVSQTRENPVFYVQYAHARCRSVLRAAAERYGEMALAESDVSRLESPPELDVLRRLMAWPRMVQAAAIAREPHRIAFFLYDLAADFHMLWNRGKDDSALRFLQAEDDKGNLARLALVAAVASVIRSGLAVLGVEPVEEMR
jgi:arginyl-tRNA synthetase